MEKSRANLTRYKLFTTLLAWVVGTWLQLHQASLDSAITYVLYVSAAVLISAYIIADSFAKSGAMPRASWQLSSSTHGFLCLILLSTCAACTAFGFAGLRSVVYASHQLQPAYEGRDIEVTGVVATMPQVNEIGTRFQLDVESALLLKTSESVQTKERIQLPSKISLSWYGDAGITSGERWRLTVRLKAPHGNSNPNGFDFELWLWEQGVQATGYVRTSANDPVPTRLQKTWQHPIEQLRFNTREAIYMRMSSGNPSRHSNEAGIVAALVTGDQQAIDRSDWDVFRATGVAHLMSISGLHITMFAWVAVLVVSGIYRRSMRLCLAFPATHAALLGGLLLATAYAVFSGWGVPSQRTILMLATVTLLRIWGKHWPWTTVWMLTCAVVVAVDPWALLQAGFWLSFVAVGVLFATDASLPDREYSSHKKVSFKDVSKPSLLAVFGSKAWQRIQLSSREQFIITLVLTPLTLLLFGQVSTVGLFANAFAIPWVTLVVTPLAMFGVIFSPSWDLAGIAVQVLSGFLGSLAELPFATFSVAVAPWLISVLAVAGGVLMVLRLPCQLRFLGVPLLLPVVLWQAPRPAIGQFEMIAADVGQGNAVIIKTATHTLVYDAGPRYSIESDAGTKVMLPLLKTTNERVDMVVLSHRDTDHSGGIKSVLGMHSQAKFLSSIEDTHELQLTHTVQRCAAGQAWQWDGVHFAVLHPASEDYALMQKSNAMSCVLRVSTTSASVLLTGDIELAQEAKLVVEYGGANLEENLGLKSTVLLVPHHGSKTSSSAAFLDAVQPKFAVVQAGYRNRFGHPVASVIERYKERAITVIDSAHCGALLWKSAAPKETQCQRDTAKRYWHHQVP